MNKPVYLDLSTLQINKITMRKFCYCVILVRETKIWRKRLSYVIYTDSFIIYIETKDIYVDIAKDIK